MTVQRLSQCHMPTAQGEFELVSFQDTVSSQVHIALVCGDIKMDEETLVRVHMADPLNDLLGGTRDTVHWPLDEVMAEIQRAGKGILVVLRQPEQNKRLADKVELYQQQDRGDMASGTKMGWDMRTFGVGAQILADLGVKKMRVMGTPTKLTGLSGFGLELVGYAEGRQSD